MLTTLASAAAVGVFSGLASAAAAAKPTVDVPYAQGVTYSSAWLNDYFNAHRQPANYYFQYGTTRGYGAQTPLAPGGNAGTPVKLSRQITGLKPLTLYHFRLVAISAAGVSTSGDRTFTTAKVPLSLRIAGVPNPAPFGESLLVEGTLSGTGSANHAVELQANPFPYLGGFKAFGNSELTSATGSFSFPIIGLLENAQLRVQTLGAPTITSPVVVEYVSVKATFHVRRTRRHGFVRLYGTVTPAEVGAQVGFQRLVAGGRTVNDGGTVVKAGSSTVSSFSRTIRLRHRGVYRALIKVSDGAHVFAYSAPVLVR